MTKKPREIQDPLFTSKDDASTSGLTSAVETLLPALEQFLHFDGPEQIAVQRATWSAQLDEPLPRTGAGEEAVLVLMRDVVIPNGLRTGDPGFSGWVATIPTTIPAAAHLAAAIAGSSYMGTQAFNLLEAIALRWLAELLGIPHTYQGIFTSGGSVANIVGLGAARQNAAARLGLDAARDGIETLPRPRIY